MKKKPIWFVVSGKQVVWVFKEEHANPFTLQQGNDYIHVKCLPSLSYWCRLWISHWKRKCKWWSKKGVYDLTKQQGKRQKNEREKRRRRRRTGPQLLASVWTKLISFCDLSNDNFTCFHPVGVSL